jgi:hypothetical protein
MRRSNLTKLLTVALLVLSAISVAQNITGQVVDEDKQPLEFASIAVLNSVDSTLVSYASTDGKGNFKVEAISNGKRMFQINLIGYQVYQKSLDFVGTSINYGTIVLKEKSNTLDEVSITAVIPISIKKDTMAFNTKAFKVRVDDNVEDLFKKLPGVEVDANGKVKAQGEDVTKVYVDGKEFFGGDPAVAMKNLSADAIKKVEVVDEKTDKARVSGVNDSERAKVINLVLKDDRKVNDFGKFQGGYGTDNRYLTSASYNRFSPKVQASVIGKFNNVNTTGSDISEIMSFGGGSGGFSISRGGAGGGSAGFITTGIGGVNLGYELAKKQNLNTDYFYNYSNTNSGNVVTKRTEFIGTDRLYSESASNSGSTTKSHRANVSFIDRSDALKYLSVRGRFRSSTTEGNSASSFEGYTTNNVKDIDNTSTSNSKNERNSGAISLDYNRRFKEASKRSIEIELDVDFSNSTSFSGNSATKVYTDALQPTEVTSSTKNQEDKDHEIDLEIEYTEPISEQHFIEVGAGLRLANTDQYTNQSQLLNGTTNSESTFEADLFEERTTAYGSLDYRFNNEKTSVSIGTELEEQVQDFGLVDAAEFNRKYSSLNPSVRFRYRPKKGSWMFVRYRKSLDLPSLNNLSPVVNNFNPLFIRQGNQNLSPEKRHSLFGMYGNYNFVTGFSFYARMSYDSANNAIVNTEDTDIATRVRTSSYINLGTRNSFSGDISFGNRLKKLGIRYNLGLNYGTSNYQSVINTVNNKTNAKNTGVRMSFENNKKDFLDMSVGANFNQNITSFSGATEDRKYVQQSYFVKSDWNITKSFNVTTQFKYDVYRDDNFDTDQAVPIWNASVSYAFLKSKAMNIKLTALDMLNKNVGFARSGSDNYFQETTRDVLGTYYMLSLTYTLNGNKAPKGASNSRGRRSRRWRG